MHLKKLPPSKKKKTRCSKKTKEIKLAVLALGRLYCCCSLRSPPSTVFQIAPPPRPPCCLRPLPSSVSYSSSPLPPPSCPRGWRSRRRSTSSGRTRSTRGRSSTPRPSPTPWSTSAPSSLVVSTPSSHLPLAWPLGFCLL